MKKANLFMIVFFILIMIGFGFKKSTIPLDVKTFSFDLKWSKKHLHNNRLSPEIKMKKVPEGTVSLKWNFINLQIPESIHGNGEIKYSGKILKPGSLKGYYGPYRKENIAMWHTYEFKIEAIDQNGKIIGTALKKIKFRMKRKDHYLRTGKAKPGWTDRQKWGF